MGTWGTKIRVTTSDSLRTRSLFESESESWIYYTFAFVSEFDFVVSPPPYPGPKNKFLFPKMESPVNSTACKHSSQDHCWAPWCAGLRREEETEQTYTLSRCTSALSVDNYTHTMFNFDFQLSDNFHLRFF